MTNKEAEKPVVLAITMYEYIILMHAMRNCYFPAHLEKAAFTLHDKLKEVSTST